MKLYKIQKAFLYGKLLNIVRKVIEAIISLLRIQILYPCEQCSL